MTPRSLKRRGLLICAAVLATAAPVAGVLVPRALATGTDSQQQVVEAYVTAGLRYDWRSSWELLCREEQLDRGSFEEYVEIKEVGAAVVGRPSNDDIVVTIGEVRSYTGSGPGDSVVDVQLTRDDETHDIHVVVVREDDGFRACGQL